MRKTIWVIILLLLWEAGVRLTKVSPLIVPSITDVFRALGRDLTGGFLLSQTFFSLALIALGLFLSLALAVLFTFLGSVHPALQDLIDTITALAHPLPGLALMPLIILWFGTGTGAVFVIIVHAALWPLILNLTSGVKRTPQIYADVGRNLSMKPTAVFFEIRMRYALPDLISGARIGWARGWRAFIGAEMVFGAVGPYGGLGSYLLNRRTFMDTAGLFAGIVLIVLIGLAVESGLFRLLEKRTVDKWGVGR